MTDGQLSPAQTGMPSTVLAAVPANPESRLIGPYKLLQQIGEGGFGVVYMAEQENPVRRVVALKVIKQGMDTAQVIARFESERQALALMDHPNIAKVLDAGTTPSGHPYFVMELVKGLSITEFCDKNHLTPETRLKLFIDACHAIQHAHHKGIIHRDIKPTNVLVTLHDSVPVVKVIDFGVAKATAQKLTEKTLFTTYGQMIGTPEYMSPEQAEMSALDIDTRSDIYSLGVLLYELLTGTTPLEAKRLRAAGYAKMQQLIREDEPPRPSTRLSSLGETATVVASKRGLDVQRLVRLLASDLDWVVMKALEKDRNRRYATPDGFAEDIQRYLRHEAIEARPPTAGYRLKKAVQRNRVAVLTASAVAIALLAGTGVSTWQAVRATRAEKVATASAAAEQRASEAAKAAAESEKAARQAAVEREAETKAVLGFVQDHLFAAARPDKQGGGIGRGVTLQKAIESALPYVETSFRNDPLIEARLRLTMAWSYIYLGDGRMALQQAEKARLLFTRHLGTQNADTLASGDAVSAAYSAVGRSRDALKLDEETFVARKAALGVGHRDTLRSMLYVAADYSTIGRCADALKLDEAALTIAKATLRPDDPYTIDVMQCLGHDYMASGRYSDAQSLFEATLAARKATLGPDHPDTCASMSALADSYMRNGRYAACASLSEQALALQTATVGPDNPATMITMEQLGVAYYFLGRLDDAARVESEALRLQKAKLGDNHLDTVRSMMDLGQVLMRLGRLTEAIKLEEEATAKAKQSSYDRLHLSGMELLATCYQEAGRINAAMTLREEQLTLSKNTLGHDHPLTLRSMRSVADSYTSVGRHIDALKIREEALTLQKVKLSPGHPETLMTMAAVAKTLMALNRSNEARPIIAEGAVMWEKLSLTDVNGLYNAACFRALSASVLMACNEPASSIRDADLAMHWLKKAIAAGLNDPSILKRDTDLNALHDRDDFKRLVATLEDNATQPEHKPVK